MLVTHGADLHAALTLPVALGEELLHDAVGPLPVQLQGLGGVAEVGTVHHVLQDLTDHTQRTSGNVRIKLDSGDVISVDTTNTVDKLSKLETTNLSTVNFSDAERIQIKFDEILYIKYIFFQTPKLFGEAAAKYTKTYMTCC